MRLAYFISPHGFGHAARAAAVMAECRRLRPDLEFDLYGGTPRWFFEQSLDAPFDWTAERTDVGLVQATALAVDLAATAEALERFIPFAPADVERLAARLVARGCRGVLCDISPLGIAAARVAGLPSILIENFTWDWIYEPMARDEPRLGARIEPLREVFAAATRHVQVEPVCLPRRDADLTAAPVARRPLRSRDAAREALGLGRDERVVLVTLGGFPQPVATGELRRFPKLTFIVTGVERTRREGNLLFYDNDTPLYMPDLIRAADALVAKLGYSTVAEVWQEGRPMAWIARSSFRETPRLERFAEAEMPGFGIPDSLFLSGGWIERIEELLAIPGVPPRPSGGAEAVARFALAETGLAP